MQKIYAILCIIVQQKMDGKFVRGRKNFMGAKHEKRFVSLFDLHDSFRPDLYFPFLLVAGRYLQGHVS